MRIVIDLDGVICPIRRDDQAYADLVMKRLGKITLDWLEAHGIEYDEIYFGKPNGEIYLDDRGIRFEDWDSISEELLVELAHEK